MIRRSKNVPILHSFVQNLLLKCQSYWGALLFRPSPTSGFDPCPLCKKHPSLFGERCFWLGWQGSGMFLPRGPEHWGPALTRKARMGAQRSPGALLLRPSPTSGFDPCLCTKSTPPFSGRGAFGWAGRGRTYDVGVKVPCLTAWRYPYHNWQLPILPARLHASTFGL